ncbi:hypothetical protein [Streptomyces formicae]|uniref:Uncharacterized protein n=1 Tax=Streptomyces formicae TaxID=1616117 RepID=A0A291QHJ5_9ACTN|nr:hypothetical protein [Streptomyces formicae]ATL30986.1 hypothetical protein KY5_5968c [Streptomyces formicae]
MAVRLGRKPYIARRLGVPPRQRGSLSGETCPDIFELSDGNFAVIGTDATETLRHALPPGLVCSQDQRIVVITRETLLRARSDIPDA